MTQLAKQPENPFSLITPELLKELDVDKLERVFALQERINEKNSEKDFNSALAAFQAEMPPVCKNRQETTGKYRWAAYEDIMRIAKPFLQRNGLAVTFSQSESAESLTIVCKVAHIGGHAKDTPFTLPKDGPIKTRDGRNITSMAQAQGSANSYAKRYCLQNALGIVVTDEDDDGRAASGPEVTEEEIENLHNLYDQIPEESKAGFLTFMGVERCSEIRGDQVAKATKALNAKIKATNK